MNDTFKDTVWENNTSAQRIINGWFKKANEAHGDAGNYFVRQLEDMGYCGDTRSGLDFGNEPEKISE